MRIAIGLIALLALGFLMPLGTVAALQCTPPPLVDTAGLRVTYSVCEENESWGYSYDPGSTCHYVDPIRVDGILVPGSDQNYCLPGGPISNSGSGTEPVATVCVSAPVPPPPQPVPPVTGCTVQTIYTDPNCVIANSPPFHFLGSVHYCTAA